MDYQDILVSTEDSIGIVTLNSPGTINALSKNMIKELMAAFNYLRDKGEIKVIIIKANGKHFCSGHNLSEMVDATAADAEFIFNQCCQLMSLIHELPQIVIAQVHGVATAAGCQLVATCDLAVAEQGASFGTPGVRIGLFCTTPMVGLSRAVGRKKALEMLVTGRLIKAEEAEKAGLINTVTTKVELEKVTMDIAKTIADASPLVLAIGKKGFYDQIELDEPQAYNYAKNVITLNLMAEDAQEGIKAFLEKRKPQWKGK